MKKHKNKIIFGIAAAAILAFAFWWGGSAPGISGRDSQPAAGAEAAPQASVVSGAPVQEAAPEDATAETETSQPPLEEKSEENIKKPGEPATPENKPAAKDGAPMSAEEKTALAAEMSGGASNEHESGDGAYSKQHGMQLDASTGKDQYGTEAVPEGRPVPVEPQNAVITDEEHTCTLSVRCDTILNNMAWLDKNKAELVPKDGVIFAEQSVTFYEGESVFNLLLREMKKNKIHLEFQNEPIYNSAYIEGINNLYEFDCGELSGWRYKVNGWFPNFGCSRYQLKQGDKVEWVYTCDLGADVGASYAPTGE